MTPSNYVANRRRVNKIKSDVAKYLRERKRKQEQTRIEQLLSGPQGHTNFWKAWSVLNGKQSTPSSEGPIRFEDETASSDSHKAKLFSEYLRKAHQKPPGLSDIESEANEFCKTIRTSPSISETNVHGSAEVTKTEIEKFVKTLKPKAPGPDRVTNQQLRNLSPSAIEVLSRIFTSSLLLGVVPSSWKESVVVMVPKPNKPRDSPRSYRPISLTSCLGKLFECSVKKRFDQWCESNKLYGLKQTAYRKGMNTNENLLRLTQFASEALQWKETCLVCFLDVEAAFDKVWHEGLLFKLSRKKCPEYLLRWISSYLDRRTLRVRVGVSLSDIVIIEAGVPQGGVLSPQLFIFYVGDMPQNRDQNSQYADDIAVWIRSRSVVLAAQAMQAFLRQFEAWSLTWKININASKSTLVAISFQKFRRQDIEITLKAERIQVERSAMFLGVKIDEKLTWNDHVEYLRAQVAKRMFALRSLAAKNVSKDNLLLIYRLGIRSKLEYGLPAWRNCSASLVHDLEVMQTKTLRAITWMPKCLGNDALLQYCGASKIIRRIEDISIKTLNKVRNREDLQYLLLNKRQCPAISKKTPLCEVLNDETKLIQAG